MNAGASVGAALEFARQCGLARLDAQLLLGHLLGKPRSWLLAHDDEILAARDRQAFDHAVHRRAAGEPLAYLTGEKEFHGLLLSVRPGVLVPRPDTETLVDWALELLGQSGPLGIVAQPEVLDMGTGSGAIALAVRHACPRARVTAVDASPSALEVARRNGERLGLGVEWRLGDWWSGLEDGRRFHLLLSNPPYIADGDPHLRSLAHEPVQALRSGSDGLDALRVLAGGARAHALAGAWALFEHGWEQGPAVSGLLAAAGGADIATRCDLAGRPRCTGARL